jgi:predicted double-glycine peptidase
MLRVRASALGILMLTSLAACGGQVPSHAVTNGPPPALTANPAVAAPSLGNAGADVGDGLAAVAVVAPPETTTSVDPAPAAPTVAPPVAIEVATATSTASGAIATTTRDAAITTSTAAAATTQTAEAQAVTTAIRKATDPSPARTMSANLPVRASLGPLEFISQTLNNCGPASVAEVLNYWGNYRTQGQVQAILRADGNPGGMVPYGVPSYMHSLGMDVVIGVGGTDEEIKALVAAGFPVIVNQWVSPENHYGHFRPIEAYDDARGGFVSSDPYLGPDHFISYADFDEIWNTNSRRFIVIYPPSRQAAVQATLAASGWDKATTYQADLTKQEQRQTPHTSVANAAFRNSDYRQGYGALNLAWDELQLGQFDAARASLKTAASGHANPVVVNWIAQLLP